MTRDDLGLGFNAYHTVVFWWIWIL